MRESDDDLVATGKGGGGGFGLRGRDEEDEFEAEADLKEEREGLRGGNGGAGAGRFLGGESRLMRGGGCFLAAESETCLGVGLGARGGGFRATGGFWRGTYGRGPSSTTQSLRSIRDVFLPSMGGDGEGEGGIIFIVAAAVDGRMGCERVEAVGESGDSRRSGGGLETTVAVEDCMASKAWTLALTAEEAMRAEREGEDARRGAREQQRSRADNAQPVACESGEQAGRAHSARQTPGPVAHVPEAPRGT